MNNNKRYLIIDKKPRNQDSTNEAYAIKRIKEELDLGGIESTLYYFDDISLDFKSNELTIRVGQEDIRNYTHILMRGHSLNNKIHHETKVILSDYIEQYNCTNTKDPIHIYNSKACKNLSYYDKIYISWICTKHKLPFLDTYYMANGKYTVKHDQTFPLIMKEYSGFNDLRLIDGEEKIKKNVYLVEKQEDYEQEYLKDKDLSNFFEQEFITTAEDYRIFVKNGQVIGGWKRKATTGFMTVAKGLYTMYNNPEPEMKDVAERFAKAIEADFVAVDFMYKNAKPHILEISLHPGFKAYETKIEGEPTNIAKAIIESF